MLNVLCTTADGRVEGINPVELETEKGQQLVAHRCGFSSYQIFLEAQKTLAHHTISKAVTGPTSEETESWGAHVNGLADGAISITDPAPQNFNAKSTTETDEDRAWKEYLVKAAKSNAA